MLRLTNADACESNAASRYEYIMFVNTWSWESCFILSYISYLFRSVFWICRNIFVRMPHFNKWRVLIVHVVTLCSIECVHARLGSLCSDHCVSVGFFGGWQVGSITAIVMLPQTKKRNKNSWLLQWQTTLVWIIAMTIVCVMEICLPPCSVNDSR